MLVKAKDLQIGQCFIPIGGGTFTIKDVTTTSDGWVRVFGQTTWSNGDSESYTKKFAEDEHINVLEVVPKVEINSLLERFLGLHQKIELLYVVDGYQCSFSNDDGNTWQDFKANRPMEALVTCLSHLVNKD